MGHWGVKGDTKLQRIARSMCHLILQRFGVQVSGNYVAAHRGDQATNSQMELQNKPD